MSCQIGCLVLAPTWGFLMFGCSPVTVGVHAWNKCFCAGAVAQCCTLHDLAVLVDPLPLHLPFIFCGRDLSSPTLRRIDLPNRTSTIQGQGAHDILWAKCKPTHACSRCHPRLQGTTTLRAILRVGTGTGVEVLLGFKHCIATKTNSKQNLDKIQSFIAKQEQK